jgi:hypothetical protein
MIQTEDSDQSETKDTNDVDSCFLPLRRKTMAVTKFQVMLNDLLLKHKANLLLYDEIINLVSTYISSPDFNRYDKFKSRKSLLQSTEKALNTIRGSGRKNVIFSNRPYDQSKYSDPLIYVPI